MEGSTNVINLSEESLPVVQAMMAFLYGGSSAAKDVNADNLSQLNFWVDLHTLAHRTMIKKLIARAAEKFHDQAKTCWTSEAFFDVCREVYSRLPNCTVALRGVICTVVVEHLGPLSKRTEFADLLQDIPTLAIEVSLAIGKSLRTYRCNNTRCDRPDKQWAQTVEISRERCALCCHELEKVE